MNCSLLDGEDFFSNKFQTFDHTQLHKFTWNFAKPAEPVQCCCSFILEDGTMCGKQCHGKKCLGSHLYGTHKYCPEAYINIICNQCQFCEKPFANTSAANRHIETAQNNGCCPTFASKSNAHLAPERPSLEISCRHLGCLESFETLALYNHHIRTNHPLW